MRSYPYASAKRIMDINPLPPYVEARYEGDFPIFWFPVGILAIRYLSD